MPAKSESKNKSYRRRFTNAMADKLKKVGGLRAGGGGRTPDTLCVMEAVAYVTGQSITDRPVCVSPTIRDFLVYVNDSTLSTRNRSQLKKIIPSIIGTRPVRKSDWNYIISASTPAFERAEKRREDHLRTRLVELGGKSSSLTANKPLATQGVRIRTRDNSLVIPMKSILTLVEELVAIK
jgi:hypothetical protein